MFHSLLYPDLYIFLKTKKVNTIKCKQFLPTSMKLKYEAMIFGIITKSAAWSRLFKVLNVLARRDAFSYHVST